MNEEELRPVEALWLLNRENKQNWSRETCLRAVLVDLATRGLLEPEDDEESFEPTDKEPESELRQYEKDVLTAVEGEDDQQEMVNSVYEFEFESFFIDRGVLSRETSTKDLSILSYTIYEWEDEEIVESDQYDTLIAQILETEGDLRVGFEKDELKSKEVPMVFAFQDSDWFEEFEESDLEECVIDPDSVEVNSLAGSDGSYVATNPAIMAATASASATCASTAATSCTASSAGATGGV